MCASQDTSLALHMESAFADTTIAHVGLGIGWFVSATNTGPAAAHGVRVTHTLPVASGLAWTVGLLSGSCSTAGSPPVAVSCALATLAPGAEERLFSVVDYHAPTEAAGPVTAIAALTSENGGSSTQRHTITVIVSPPACVGAGCAPLVARGEGLGRWAL